MKFVCLAWAILGAGFSTISGAPLQLVVATTSDTAQHRAELRLFSRSSPMAPWKADGNFAPVLLGKKGLAWGLGLNPAQAGLQKMEHDGRSPAGRFRIGLIMGTEASLPPGAKWTEYHQISSNDAWPDDPSLPEYNQLFTLPSGQSPPPWFAKHRMRVNDPAYHWLVVIEHNYPHPIPGRGSAIFFHTRRGEDVPSSGCTVMAREVLVKIITWLDPVAHPEFVLLSEPDYQRLWAEWDLPAPGLAIP